LTLFCNIIVAALFDKVKSLSEDELVVDNTDVVIEQS
jgi:hypothetical protein